MKSVTSIPKAVGLSVLLVVSALLSSQALAGSSTIRLRQEGGLVNVNDPAGLYQHEGGSVLNVAGAVIGKYVITRRVTPTGTAAYNTAATTITIFFSVAGIAPPQNITLQGAHSFNTGRFVGSVGAGSNRYNWLQGADASTVLAGGVHTLTLSWAGANQLALP